MKTYWCILRNYAADSQGMEYMYFTLYYYNGESKNIPTNLAQALTNIGGIPVVDLLKPSNEIILTDEQRKHINIYVADNK